MNSTITRATPLLCTTTTSGVVTFSQRNDFQLHQGAKSKLREKDDTFLAIKSVKRVRKYDSITIPSRIRFRSGNLATEPPLTETPEPELVADKLQRIVSEFKSLSEPIDRVKRLLNYAAVLDPPDESVRVPENRVTGCTIQMWLDVEMNEFGRMRFKGDSDSEIMKGFMACLVWIVDGADPSEVLRVRAEELDVVSVGLNGREKSRVNTWHNVLMSMQKRTKDLVVAREAKPPLETLSSLIRRL